MIKAEVPVPLLNANEPEARLAGIHVKDGQYVDSGTVLFTLETTKAATDIESPEAGYIRVLGAVGDLYPVGDLLAVITSTAEEPLDSSEVEKAVKFPSKETPSGLRITRPAQALAEQLGLDLAKLPEGGLITEEVVRKFAGVLPQPESASLPLFQASSAELLIYGGGGHAKSVMDMVLAMGTFRIAGIIDDNIPAGTTVLGIPVLGNRAILPELVGRGIRLAANGVGGILDINIRVKLFELLEGYGFSFPILKHPRATVERSAIVGDGTQIFGNAYVGSEAVLHDRCMVNTGAVISHDCEIGAYSHIAPGAMLAGHVHVGERALVGMGVTTAIGIRIGSGVRIGNGAILYSDVPDKTVIPAGKVWAGQG